MKAKYFIPVLGLSFIIFDTDAYTSPQQEIKLLLYHIFWIWVFIVLILYIMWP